MAFTLKLDIICDTVVVLGEKDCDSAGSTYMVK